MNQNISAPRPAERPLVSITMPTYNRAHLVGLAIDAVLGQTYANFELIIVNDGSRDNTRDVLDACARQDPRVRVIHKENEGIPDTVNRGWRESRGKYVTWTSDDNLYHPTTIEVMVDFLERHTETALVYTDCRYIDADGKVLFCPPGSEPDVLESYCPIMGSLLFRRAVFEDVDMFRKQWKRVHDYDFYRRIWMRFPVARIPEVLYDYRLHDASMTGNHYAMTTEQAQLLASFAAGASARRAAWGWCWHELARQAERENRHWSAVGYYLRAAFQQPKRFATFRKSLRGTLHIYSPELLRNAWRMLTRRGGNDVAR